jgi:hypothetical protein
MILRAGTVYAGIDLIIRDSNSHPRAAASISYTTFLGLEGHEQTIVDSLILGADAGYSGTLFTPASWSIEGSEPVAPPNCYQGRVVATTDDSTTTVLGNKICVQGPPPPPPPPPDPGPGGGCANCGDDGGTESSSGAGSEPLVINLSGPYKLSGLDDPVSFDIRADGHPLTIGWTARGEDVAFLVLDRNGNGRIDDGSELFGNATPLNQGGRAPNGFVALAQYDANGDGLADAADPVWSQLLLWVDSNHNGVSEPGELRAIAGSPITAVEFQYHWTGRRDQSGNWFGYEGHLHEGKRVRSFYDVFFVTAQ